MQDDIEDSDEISPVVRKRLGEEGKAVMGLRSWAETLQPRAEAG
jgi:hypothetical protein